MHDNTMTLTTVPVDAITVSALNTRKNLNAGGEDTSLDDLIQSIAERGLINPPTLRSTGDGSYEVVAGQRRILAFRRLGYAEIPAVIAELSDNEAVAMSLVENVQRADMDPIDKANAYNTLLAEYGSTSAVATATGVSPKTVKRYLALRTLPVQLQAQVRTGNGPAGVGFMSRLADTFPDVATQQEIFDKLKGFSAGLAEEIVQRSGGDASTIDALVDLAIQGQFDRHRCGTSLETCPHLPNRLRPAIRALLDEP